MGVLEYVDNGEAGFEQLRCALNRETKSMETSFFKIENFTNTLYNIDFPTKIFVYLKKMYLMSIIIKCKNNHLGIRQCFG